VCKEEREARTEGDGERRGRQRHDSDAERE